MARQEKPLWTWDAGKGKFCCTHPGCEYEHAHQGAVQLHHVRKHQVQDETSSGGGQVKKTPQQHQESQKTRQPQANSSDVCPPHRWRLLNPNDGQEAKALAAGYERICKLCTEVE